MKKMLLMFLLLFNSIMNADNRIKDYSVYFFGLVEHFSPTKETNEGNLNYLSISKTMNFDYLNMELGVGSYTDSYEIDSYKAYINFSKDKYIFGPFRPLLGLALHSKGVEYGSKERKVFVLPSLKFRIGYREGMFINIMPIPKVYPYTNGFVATEIGYKF